MSDDQTHEWVTFSNPRNGRVQICACANCGTAREFVSSDSHCMALPEGKHKMKRLGWIQVSKARHGGWARR